MTAARRQATPSPRRMLQRFADQVRQRLERSRRAIALESTLLLRLFHPMRLRAIAVASGPRWIINLAVAVLVLSLPLAATAASDPAAAPKAPVATLIVPTNVARAQSVSRVGSITAGRSIVTVEAAGVRPIIEYTLGPNDTLGSIASFFKLSPEALAYANGITDPKIERGRTIRIPPGDGALYTVRDGDTIESVAKAFSVEPKVIMEYNRLTFEPEHFAPGKLIFVEGATLPGLVYHTVDAQPQRPTVIARAAAPAPAIASSGRLSWPVGGYVSQYFWYGHTGVDIAAPYASGLAASADGTVTRTGWVPVGGLSVCVKHAGNVESCYYHTGAVFVTPGQRISRGQIIATIGMTGVSTGPHVHWETKVNGVLVNPFAQ